MILIPIRRTMCIIWLFDCALRFYSNFPCRLSLSELKNDLPCAESVFRAEHPFAVETFQFRRTTTASQAFHMLFRNPTLGVESAGSTPKPSKDVAHPLWEHEQHLTVLDLFLLIHRMYPSWYRWHCIGINLYLVLYVFMHSHITMLSACAPESRDDTRVQQSVNTGGGSMVSDTIPSKIRTALSNWRVLWIRSCQELSEDKRAGAGMYKNGDSFWLVIQLLRQNQAVANAMGSLDVNCEDTLARLGTLLQESSQ
jgi:hypothetical protein